MLQPALFKNLKSNLKFAIQPIFVVLIDVFTSSAKGFDATHRLGRQMLRLHNSRPPNQRLTTVDIARQRALGPGFA